jgi:acyl-coenzyme A synthetase/AMP-(fatty) acid ligase
VLDVAVVGLPDSTWGEVVAAYVVLRDADPEGGITGELTALAAQRLASYKQPRRWFAVESLPRNAMGKVRRDLLRDSAAEG